MRAYDNLTREIERAMGLKAALTLFEWDCETLAPPKAQELTSSIIGTLSGEYFNVLTSEKVQKLLAESMEDKNLSENEIKNLREIEKELSKILCIPEEEYKAFAALSSKSAAVWAEAREENDFKKFEPYLEEVIEYQKKFASYRKKEGQKLYDVLLEDFEEGFTMDVLDGFFDLLREEIVPLLRKIRESKIHIDNGFLEGDYSVEKQAKLAKFLASYVGFDFSKGVLAVSAHPFTTNLHNKDVRITTNYGSRVDSSIFSVIHESGHGIYEQNVDDSITHTFLGQGAGMATHESQSRFFENIIGRSESFWEPIYQNLKETFESQLKDVELSQFVAAINRVEPGFIRIEADELTYGLHILIRYEIEKAIFEKNINVSELPELWAEKYEEYLGIRPATYKEGILQDIHWSQGAFGYFPSYALGSAFGAQLYAHMCGIMDFDGLLRKGNIKAIREFLRENHHRYGKLKNSRQLIVDITGEDFNPNYYIKYLKDKFSKLYGIQA